MPRTPTASQVALALEVLERFPDSVGPTQNEGLWRLYQISLGTVEGAMVTGDYDHSTREPLYGDEFLAELLTHLNRFDNQLKGITDMPKELLVAFRDIVMLVTERTHV